MRKVKCKYCNELITECEDLIILKEKTKSDKSKNIHLHKSCQNDYIELMEYKENEIKWFNEVYEYIKELLNYSNTQKLPNSLVTRIQDLRNGTVMQRGVGRVIKSKEGYTYQTILNTFLTLSDKIRWALENKDFTSEANKISYMMAIIDSNINDLVVQENTVNNKNNIKSKNNLIDDEKDNRARKKVEYIPQSKGIAKFLDEDDF
jgi:hypothetical protein